jgi:membrane-associated phospholipid phosphatase
MSLAPVLLLWAVTLGSGPVAPPADAIEVEPGTVERAAADSPPRAPRSGRSDDQTQIEEKEPPTPPTGIHALLDGLKEDVRHLPSKPSLYLTLIGGGLAAAVHPVDQTFNVRLRSHSDFVNGVFTPARYYGNVPEQLTLSIGTYAFGRMVNKPRVSHLGMDLLRAQAVTELLVEPLKLAIARRRPDGSDHQSFPSGHAAVTFAAATVIERHLGWKNSVLGYAIASYVAASRLHDNRHYLSDVVFGAALGSIAGLTVTKHGRDTWTLSPAPVRGGIAILAARTP